MREHRGSPISPGTISSHRPCLNTILQQDVIISRCYLISFLFSSLRFVRRIVNLDGHGIRIFFRRGRGQILHWCMLRFSYEPSELNSRHFPQNGEHHLPWFISNFSFFFQNKRTLLSNGNKKHDNLMRNNSSVCAKWHLFHVCDREMKLLW